ncbi:MAG: hypothetical protein MHM6MM_005376 [Cercozoa sp. M6MM]
MEDFPSGNVSEKAAKLLGMNLDAGATVRRRNADRESSDTTHQEGIRNASGEELTHPNLERPAIMQHRRRATPKKSETLYPTPPPLMTRVLCGTGMLLFIYTSFFCGDDAFLGVMPRFLMKIGVAVAVALHVGESIWAFFRASKCRRMRPARWSWALQVFLWGMFQLEFMPAPRGQLGAA